MILQIPGNCLDFKNFSATSLLLTSMTRLPSLSLDMKIISLLTVMGFTAFLAERVIYFEFCLCTLGKSGNSTRVF